MACAAPERDKAFVDVDCCIWECCAGVAGSAYTLCTEEGICECGCVVLQCLVWFDLGVLCGRYRLGVQLVGRRRHL